MAQQLINIGTAANDRTGDTWRDAFDKTNQNFTELYGLQGADPVVFVAQESDFPTQDATTITLEDGKIYQYTASFSTAKRFIVEDGAKLTAFNFFSPVLTYSGTGSMFTGTDASFTINECRIDCPNAQVFNFTDSVGGLFLFLMDKVRIVSASKFGTFNNLQTVLIEGSSSLAMTQGITVTGSDFVIFSISKLFLGTSSASFVGIDFGTAISQTIEIDDFVATGPSGSIGIKGASGNANVPSGVIASVVGCNFSGIGTPLSGITTDDVRWAFRNNSAVSDTNQDALISMHGNATNTTIAAINTPVLVEGTWNIEASSHFTSTTGGRATYNGERNFTVPIGVTATVYAASGTNKDVKLYIAKNGTAIANSGMLERVDSSDPKTIVCLWQEELALNDYIEVFAENTTDTTDILVSDIVLRVR